MKIQITQSIYDPYTNKEGKLVDYTRTETIEGYIEDGEMLISLINIITTTFKNVEISISTNAEEKE